MIYNGRYIDVLSLWGEYVDIPPNVGNPLPTFLPLVQCPNPDHQTTKRHFQINTKKPLVHCFAHCGISGTYEEAIAKIKGVSLREARKLVLRASRVPLAGEVASQFTDGTRKAIGSDDALAKDERAFIGGTYSYLPKEARAFLARRGIDGVARGKWQIGFDEDAERLVIPALDRRGNLRFLIRQRIDGLHYHKYLYTDGAIKTSLLFGACYLDMEQVRSLGLILVEGPLDCIAMHQVGFRNAVAILGTGLSAKQARLVDELGPNRVYLLFDKDSAGWENIKSAKQRITKIPLYVCRYPSAKEDPAELTRKEATRSIERALTMQQFYRKTRSLRKPTKKEMSVG